MAGPSQVSPDFREPTAPADENELDNAVQTILDAMPSAAAITAIQAKTDNLPADTAAAIAALATTLVALGKMYQRQARINYSNVALDTAETTIAVIGALGGASSYRIDGSSLNIASLGAVTTTMRFNVYVDVNGVSTVLFPMDRTVLGAFSLTDLLGALPPASPYIKITVQRLTGTGAGGSLSGTLEYSKAT